MNETCKDCGQPIHWSGEAGEWYHDSTAAILACPGRYPVEMVLSGPAA